MDNSGIDFRSANRELESLTDIDNTSLSVPNEQARGKIVERYVTLVVDGPLSCVLVHPKSLSTTLEMCQVLNLRALAETRMDHVSTIERSVAHRIHINIISAPITKP